MYHPLQKVVLAVTYNTIQLVDVILETLLAQKQQLSSTNHKLVVTGRDPVPVEISHGMIILRYDLTDAHEEADVNIIHQMLSIVESSMNDINISVISDDADIFVRLVHFYHDKQLTCHVAMEATCQERKSIDIPKNCSPPQGYSWSTASSSCFVVV